MQPFIATLAGQFLARGLCYVISIDSIGIRSESYKAIALYRIPVGGGNEITANVIVLLVMFAVGAYLAHYTRFGRTVYASRQQRAVGALDEGYPSPARRFSPSTSSSGFCSAVAKASASRSTCSPATASFRQGLPRWDAIACAVVGETSPAGGLGWASPRTLLGVLVYSDFILSLIIFQGSLNSWWTKIVVGLLLLVFCLLQKVFERKQGQRSATGAARPAPQAAARQAPAS